MRRVLMFLLALLALLALSACAAPAEVAEEAPPAPAEPAPVEPAPGDSVPNRTAPEDDRSLTLEAPLADGRTLLLEAVGKQVDEYSFGVREVRVYDGEELIQTVQAREGIEHFWGDSDGGVVSEYTSCWSREESMEVLDLNFDGNTDFGLFGWPANNTIPYYYWMWDPEAGRYQYAFTLQGVSADSEKQELKSTFRLSAVEYETDYYRPDETGALYLARTEVSNWEVSGLDDRAARETWVPAPDQRLRPGAPDWSYHDLTLVRRELPVREFHDGGTISNYTEIWELMDGELQMTSREEFFYEDHQ